MDPRDSTDRSLTQSRRTFIATGCATGLGLALAGCSALESDGGNGGDGGSNGDDDLTPHDELGETLEDFEDADAWESFDAYGEFETETDDVATGSQALRLRAEEDEPYVGVTKTYDEPLDLSDKNLSIALKAIEPSQHKIEVQLVAPDTNNVLECARTHTGPSDHWLRVDIGASSETGQPDLSEVRAIRIIGRERSSGDALDYIFDEVRTVDAPDRGKVLLTFDDNHESQYTAFEMMGEYDFPGVAGIIPGAVGGNERLDGSQLEEFRDAGWDVISHPHPPAGGATPLPEYDEDEQREIIENAIQWLEDSGFEDGADHFVTPNHTRDATTLELLREYHDSSTSFGGGNGGAPLTDPHTIGRIDAYEVDTITRFVDLAEKYNQVCVPLWHIIGEEYDEHEMTEDEFSTVLEHLDDADVDVITQSELVELGR